MGCLKRIPQTDLDVFALCLGGNVFGWTVDERESFAILDAYVAAGGNFIDTADMYGSWIGPDERQWSEAIIGRWMEARGNRERVVIATKVGMMPGAEGLSKAHIEAGVIGSLRRLRTEYIDVYYVHLDDAKTPVVETLSTLHDLVVEGTVRYIGASNVSAARIATSLEVARSEGLTKYVAVQPLYNLVERAGYEADLEPLCATEKMGCFPYASLARGFLTGKYRPDRPPIESHYVDRARVYLDERGVKVLETIDAICAAHGTAPSAVALAWLMARPTVVSPLASARTPTQLAELLGRDPAAGRRRNRVA